MIAAPNNSNNNNQQLATAYLNTQIMCESSLSEELSVFDFTGNSFKTFTSPSSLAVSSGNKNFKQSKYIIIIEKKAKLLYFLVLIILLIIYI